MKTDKTKPTERPFDKTRDSIPADQLICDSEAWEALQKSMRDFACAEQVLNTYTNNPESCKDDETLTRARKRYLEASEALDVNLSYRITEAVNKRKYDLRSKIENEMAELFFAWGSIEGIDNKTAWANAQARIPVPKDDSSDK